MRDNIESYYTLVPNAVGDEYHIELKGTEKFDGVVYRYGRVQFGTTEDEDGRLTFRYEYDIVTVPKDIADQDLDESDRAELENLVGDILLNILESDLSDKEQHKDGIVKIGTDNPQVTH
jgi:hypothetical protein